MTNRDRMVLLVLLAVAIVAVGWIKVVSPEQKRASSVQATVTAAEVTLGKARAELAGAKQDQGRFASAYANLVSLGEAVPADEEVSSLVYAVDKAAGSAHVEFQSISSGGDSSAAAAPSTSTATATAGFQQLPFTFTFSGSFFDLYHLMQKLQGFTVTTDAGDVKISGRLLTLDNLSLTAATAATAASTASGQLTGTVTATAYVLPPGESLTAGATATAPAGVNTSASSGSSSSSGSTSTAAPAVVKATP